MHTIRTIILLLLTVSGSFAVDAPNLAIVTNSQQRGFEVTTSVRTNGCRLELWRYVKKQPDMNGYWVQNLYVGDKRLLQIQHSLSYKEQSLVVEQNTDYGVLQLDRDLDGKYEMLIVMSLKDQSLIDVFVTTDDGWLRHSTPEELQARQHIAEGNQHALEEFDKTLKDTAKKFIEDSKK